MRREAWVTELCTNVLADEIWAIGSDGDALVIAVEQVEGFRREVEVIAVMKADHARQAQIGGCTIWPGEAVTAVSGVLYSITGKASSVIGEYFLGNVPRNGSWNVLTAEDTGGQRVFHGVVSLQLPAALRATALSWYFQISFWKSHDSFL